jgi:uncharacterized membrane protein YeaQ/YmgE (transglycosylase-associated protein family)
MLKKTQGQGVLGDIALKSIGFSLGDIASFAKLLGFQTGGIVPGPIGAPVPILAHGGERVTPTNLASKTTAGGSGGAVFNVYIGLYSGSETEKRNIAKQLYGALVQLAQSQNKSVRELMGA